CFISTRYCCCNNPSGSLIYEFPEYFSLNWEYSGYIYKYQFTKKENVKMSKVNVAVVYYSMGGTNVQLAKWAGEAAEESGADVRILKVPELAPQSVIDANDAWKATVESTQDIAEATSDDLERSEEHTSELQSRFDLVCRLLLE